MRDRIILPRLLGFRINGFQPIFKSDISQVLGVGPNVILGGNGLGKTTIMQAIIYGLTGGNDSFEEDKELRWNHKYFIKRLDGKHKSSAAVEVDFAFGKTKFSLRRGIKTSRILAFRDTGKEGWIDNLIDANIAFEKALSQYGGYKNVIDFAFIVHRLLYLPESRRLLAWDTNSQIRTIMLLNQDILVEEDFRSRREKLKEIDSSKRHINVALEKIKAKIASSSGEVDGIPDKELHLSPLKSEGKTDIVKLTAQLRDIVHQRSLIEKDKQIASDKLSVISSEIDKLRERIEHVEATLVARILKVQEKEKSLPLFKLAEKGICPSCGTQQPKLQTQAREYLHKHQCLLCGSSEPQKADPQLATLWSQLSDKIRAQQALEKDYYIFNNKLKQTLREQDRIQYNVNEARLTDPMLTLIERDVASPMDEDPLQTKQKLEHLKADLEAQVLARRSELEKDYKEFRTAVNRRVNQLRALYATYATEFLGVDCELSETMTYDLMALKLFVPKFNNKVRDTPESCSEAQRFFLDIAFRMALLDLSHDNGKQPSTFICETPETALDMSYIDNVVQMFEKFMLKGHTMLFTANIQTNSVAGPLLKLVPKKERYAHVLNLLDIGQLSDVHKHALNALKKTVREIVG